MIIPPNIPFTRRTASPDPSGSYSGHSVFTQAPSKVHVDEWNALTYSAVFRAVSLISMTVSMLPWGVYAEDGKNREPLQDHPVDRLLRVQANPEMSAKDFRSTLEAHKQTWGNGYAEIERNRAGQPIALWPIEPYRVAAKRDDRGKLYYEIANPKGGSVYLTPDRIFHHRGLSFDGLVGYSPVRLARDSIALGLSMERFGGSFFGNGTRLSGVLEHPGEVSDPARKNITASWNEAYGSNGGGNALKVALLEEGVTFKQLSVPPEDAQFLESRQFQVTDIARWFGVPPHKLAELSKATFSNIEQQAKEFVDDAILPSVTSLEAEARIKLFDPIEERALTTKMDLRALLRGDAKARGELYKNLFNTGAFSPNDIRASEDENPVEGGDIRLVPLNMVALEHAGKPPAPAGAAPAADPAQETDQPKED